MTEVYDDDFEDDYDEVDEKPERSDSEWAELRRAKKAADKAKKELESLKSERAFEKAGLNLDDPRVAYFKKGYEGDLTPDAIRAEAVKAGFIAETVEPEPDDTPLRQQARAAAAAGGLGTDQPDLAIAGLEQAFAEGGTDAMMNYLATQGLPIAGNGQ